MLELLSKQYKPQIKYGLYAVLFLFVIYGMIYIFTPKSQMPINFKATIDSLTKANAILIEQQKRLDSNIKVYETKVEKIDFELNNIKEKTTIVKEFHHKIIERVGHYNDKQIDSFFKSRYNY